MTKAKTAAAKLREETETFEAMVGRKRAARREMTAEENSATSNWYAIKTTPGAQKPRRQHRVESTTLNKEGRARGKGYRIILNTNHDISLIERALSENGFEFYMPAEKRLVRDRRHTDLWKVRRFALMVGYVFLREPHDWNLLANTQGVSGVLRSPDGYALGIDIMDILAVRSIEAETEVYFDAQSKKARQTLRKNAKTDPRLKKLIAQLDMAGTITVPLNIGVLAA